MGELNVKEKLVNMEVKYFSTKDIYDDACNIIESARNYAYNAVNVAVKTTDTIIAVDDNGCIDFIPNRASLRNVQTPQCFKLGTIRKAYELAMKDPNFTATDDCGIVKHYLPQEPIFIVNGDYTNIKITHKEDLIILQHLINEAI
jgi:2-C-methyl-D-erythritol 4-phosphate cytidylyltransferase